MVAFHFIACNFRREHLKGYFCPKIQTARASTTKLKLARLQQHNNDKKASEQQANKQQDLVPVVGSVVSRNATILMTSMSRS